MESNVEILSKGTLIKVQRLGLITGVLGTHDPYTT